MTTLESISCNELTEKELNEINGGIWPIIGAAIAIYGAINMIAYAIGYAVGTIENTIENN